MERDISRTRDHKVIRIRNYSLYEIGDTMFYRTFQSIEPAQHNLITQVSHEMIKIAR
jgi:hypothetical protein